MDFKDVIEYRRSVRKFADTPVTEEDIKKVVELARFAPSWKNTQTTRYTAVFDKELKKKLADEAMLDFEFNQKTVDRASMIVIVSSVEKISGYEKDGSFSTSLERHWESFDAGIATQTFCLSDYSLGLGTVILGIYDYEKVAKLAGIPEGQRVSAIIAVGYPVDNEKKAGPERLGVSELLSVK